MKKSFLKISAMGAACFMLAAAAGAQSEAPNITPKDSSGNQPNRSWSTKHLSATGRADDGAIRASKLIGAQVNDSAGHRSGQIQDIILNPATGRIDFALVSLNTAISSPSTTYASPGTSSNSPVNYNTGGTLIPVPWALLRASGSSQYRANTEQPSFTVNTDQSKLTGAPAVDWSDLNQSQWRQRIYSYYGVTPESSMGGADLPQGEIKGQGEQKVQDPSAVYPTQPELQNKTPNE